MSGGENNLSETISQSGQELLAFKRYALNAAEYPLSPAHSSACIHLCHETLQRLLRHQHHQHFILESRKLMHHERKSTSGLPPSATASVSKEGLPVHESDLKSNGKGGSSYPLPQCEGLNCQVKLLVVTLTSGDAMLEPETNKWNIFTAACCYNPKGKNCPLSFCN